MIIKIKDRPDLINMAHCLIKIGDAKEIQDVGEEVESVSSVDNRVTVGTITGYEPTHSIK